MADAARVRSRVALCPPPNPGPQAAFVASDHPDVLYGGAAGGGKSAGLLLAALKYAHVPGYRAIIVRQKFVDLAMAGGIMDLAKTWLTGKAVWNANEHKWTFPSGATLTFTHGTDPERYKSAQFQFVGIDELTENTKKDAEYFRTRLRRPSTGPLSRVPIRYRAASNPDGRGHLWAKKKYVRPWEARGCPRLPLSEHEADESTPLYIPATLDDNPQIDQKAYRKQFEGLPQEIVDQLLKGRWDGGDSTQLLADHDIERAKGQCLYTEDDLMRQPGRDGLIWLPELHVGVDVGRTNDRTVVWVFERDGDRAVCRVLKVLHKAEFSEQLETILWAGALPGVVTRGIDAGGIGMMLAEELGKRQHWTSYQLSSARQGALANRMSVAFARGRVVIPNDDELDEDLRLVRKLETRQGKVVSVETAKGDSGHADRFWAAAIALDGIGDLEPGQSFLPTGVR